MLASRKVKMQVSLEKKWALSLAQSRLITTIDFLIEDTILP